MRCILGVKIPASNIPDYFDNEKTNLRERTQNNPTEPKLARNPVERRHENEPHLSFVAIHRRRSSLA